MKCRPENLTLRQKTADQYIASVAISIDLGDRVVLVTGGTRGIGAAIARRFADAGATIAICARTPPDALPDGWSFHEADLRDADSARVTVDAVADRHGRLDVLVNNAGGSPPAVTHTASPRFTERITALNLLSAMFTSQAAHPHLMSTPVQEAGGGVIVNISSVAALRPGPTVAAYAAAKAGLLSFTTTVGQEWAPGIRVNSVTAGMVRTAESAAHYGDDASAARIAAGIPMGRMADPSDIADACVFLASPLASYITGANLVVHGGGDRPPFLDDGST